MTPFERVRLSLRFARENSRIRATVVSDFDRLSSAMCVDVANAPRSHDQFSCFGRRDIETGSRAD
jgi:hypothetical protein